MIKQSYTKQEQSLQQIVDMLLLNGTLTKCPGIIYGKIGIAIFFFHYARYISNMLFSDYALDLIVELQKQLHANYRADYEKGIAGIGVGIDYLINSEFLDVETDIFEDFDERMYRATQYDPSPDFSFYNGLTGYGRYWLTRLRREPSSQQAKDCLIRITEQIEKNIQNIPLEGLSDVYCFLHDLQIYSNLKISLKLLDQSRRQVMDSHLFFPRLKDFGLEHFARQYLYAQYFNKVLPHKINKELIQIPDWDKKNTPNSIGLFSGYAGEGLTRLTALSAIDCSWIQLL